jgi:heme-degrading monooxygenase HmoA
MSVFMTMKVKGDPAKLEEYVAQHEGKLSEISNRGKAAGAIHHAFYGSEDGTIMVVDEWDSPQSFQAFFEADPDIPQVMQAVGVTSEPEVTFWRKLETHDEF